MNRSFLALLVFAPAAALASLGAACANGGSSGGASYDGGDDSTVDGATGEGGGHGEGGEAGVSEGGATSLTTACNDNAAQYCNQLSMCSQFLLQSQYGDVVTCQTRIAGAYCNDIVTAKGSGWTGDGLEACIAAHAKLSCTDFLYGKPQPAACRPTGTISSGACVFDIQCGTGYCRIAAGMECGNCVQLGNTGAACTTTNDCDGNLVCSGAACAAPVPIGLACSATAPCQSGAVCLGGKCIQPGGIGATCDADGGGADCDYNLGAYCSGGTCAAITVAMSAAPCGGSPPSVCYASGVCQDTFCVPPTADGQSCDGGVGCTAPSGCYAGTCGSPTSGMCP